MLHCTEPKRLVEFRAIYLDDKDAWVQAFTLSDPKMLFVMVRLQLLARRYLRKKAAAKAKAKAEAEAKRAGKKRAYLKKKGRGGAGASAATAATGPNNASHATALYAYTPTADGPENQLTVEVGDDLVVIDKTRSDGWFEAFNKRTGQRGLIPASYVQLVERARCVVAQAGSDGVLALDVGDIVSITSRANEGAGWFIGTKNLAGGASAAAAAAAAAAPAASPAAAAGDASSSDASMRKSGARS